MGPHQKARKKVNSPPPTRNDLIANTVRQMSEKHFGNVYTADQLNERFKILPVAPLSLQWILDSNGFFLGKIYLFEGDPSAGKSQFGYGVGESFVDAGGMFILVETENKTSQATMEAKMGAERVKSGRCVYHQTFSIDAANDASKEEKAGAWQSAVKNWIDTMRDEKNGLQDMPVFILVDSMTGVAGSETRKEYDEEGSMKARSYDGAATANSLAKYFRNLGAAISGSNITVAFTNHLKKGMVEQQARSYGESRKGVGGEQPRYHSACTLWFTRGAETKYVSKTRRELHITAHKQSFGVDMRRLTVPFYVSMKVDEGGEIMRDEEGNPIRAIDWDWDEATIGLLMRFCGLNDTKDKSVAARALFHVDYKGGKYSSKTLDVEGLTSQEMGKLINESVSVRKKLLEIQALNINQYPAFDEVPAGDVKDDG